MFGPKALGGYGDLDAQIVAAAKTQNRTEAEVIDSIYLRRQGVIIATPGTPDLYDYEFHPQEVREPSSCIGKNAYEFVGDLRCFSSSVHPELPSQPSGGGRHYRCLFLCHRRRVH
jgi:hypothetical protein